MQHGLARLQQGEPISLRLLKEIHARLLSHGRGSSKQPGEFRRSQNWIGGARPRNARFVPPPPDAVIETMGALEKFIHDEPVRTLERHGIVREITGGDYRRLYVYSEYLAILDEGTEAPR